MRMLLMIYYAMINSSSIIFVKIPAKYANISSYAHVMTVGRGDQQQLTKHLKTL